MIQIDLNTEEKEILCDLLQVALSEMRMEIADTEQQDFRENLKRRKEVIEKALASLG